MSTPEKHDDGGGELRPVETDPSGTYSRYDIVLGRGAFKSVFKAFDEEAGREVAWNQVKVNDLVSSPAERERLFAEIRVLKQLKHKNIMTFYDSWLDQKNNTVNFITELFTSGTLRQYRKKHKHIDEQVLKRWAWQILQGLVYLHGHNPPIIHRDLKCDNIFVNGTSGVIKIGDLGLVTLCRGFTAPQSVLGTPEFMAPELYEEKYDEKVDVYSFGMCLLELATMEYPYAECKNAAQIYKKVTQGIHPGGIAKVANKELREFVELCIQHDPNQRPEARQLLKHPFFESLRTQLSCGGTEKVQSERSLMLQDAPAEEDEEGGPLPPSGINSRTSSARISASGPAVPPASSNLEPGGPSMGPMLQELPMRAASPALPPPARAPSPGLPAGAWYSNPGSQRAPSPLPMQPGGPPAPAGPLAHVQELHVGEVGGLREVDSHPDLQSPVLQELPLSPTLLAGSASSGGVSLAGGSAGGGGQYGHHSGGLPEALQHQLHLQNRQSMERDALEGEEHPAQPGGGQPNYDDFPEEWPREINLHCKQVEETKLSFQLRFTEPAGHCKTIEFAFDTAEDTAECIANEMMEDLSLSAAEAQDIAAKIREEIVRTEELRVLARQQQSPPKQPPVPAPPPARTPSPPPPAEAPSPLPRPPSCTGMPAAQSSPVVAGPSAPATATVPVPAGRVSDPNSRPPLAPSPPSQPSLAAASMPAAAHGGDGRGGSATGMGAAAPPLANGGRSKSGHHTGMQTPSTHEDGAGGSLKGVSIHELIAAMAAAQEEVALDGGPQALSRQPSTVSRLPQQPNGMH